MSVAGRGFAIGLSPLGSKPWLALDAEREARCALKRRLYAAGPESVYAAEATSEDAQTEAAALVEQRLAAAGVARPPASLAAPPLLRAALQVQEDLLLMARDQPDAPWRLAAGALFFPSSWSLAEKLGRPMAEVHGPVPGFNTGSRNAAVIERIFDALRPGAPVERVGWSIYPDAALSHPPTPRDAAWEAALQRSPHQRVERQTLTKLERSGAILFTVRIHVTPLDALSPADAAGLAAALKSLDAAELAYKGLTKARAPLLRRLRAMAGRQNDAAEGKETGE